MNPVPELTPEQAEMHRRAIRIRPVVALRAMRRAVRDPDDTAQAVRMLSALAGRSVERLMARFLRAPEGPEILRRERGLLEVLIDREALRRMPAESFGRVYLEWLEREQISAEGLVTASEAASQGEGERSGPYFVLGCRMREMHDLLHVTTGYGRDIVGEVGVLAFTFAQTRHSGIGFLLLVAFVRSFFRRPGESASESRENGKVVREHLFEGYRRGSKAEWIVAADWESLLALPIDEVRRRYRIPAPPAYRELRTAGAPVLAA